MVGPSRVGVLQFGIPEDYSMAMGRRPEQAQGDFWIVRERVQCGPGHPYYERLNQFLAASGFDAFCEASCSKFYDQTLGRPSIPPGVYFRMLLIGYLEKIDSERGIAWRCADSLGLRHFLGYAPDQATPEHSTLSRARNRIDLETHQAVFDWALKRLAENGLLSGGPLGLDASTLEANAALKSIVRRDNGESYNEFISGLAKASGIETPTAAQLAEFDRKRKDKSASNDDWFNPHDPDAKIAKMKDGRTHLAHKNEHVVDLETGAILAAEIHPADQGDTTTMLGTLESAAHSLHEVRNDERVVATCKVNGTLNPATQQALDVASLQIEEVVADKGYHSAQSLTNLEETEMRGLIAEPNRGRQNWTVRPPKMPASADLRERADLQERARIEQEHQQEQDYKRKQQAAVYRNRRRIRGERSKALHRKRGELVERSFEHVLDDGGMRRVWLKGHEKISKRYKVHVAGFNLGLLMRKLTGFGTPKELADATRKGKKALRAFFRRWVASVRHRTTRILRRAEIFATRIFGAPLAPAA